MMTLATVSTYDTLTHNKYLRDIHALKIESMFSNGAKSHGFNSIFDCTITAYAGYVIYTF